MNYKHEYVSGPIFPLEKLRAVVVAVVNRGVNVQHFRVDAFREDKPWLEDLDADSLEPQEVRVWGPHEMAEGPYWFRIFATSLDVVPSLLTRESPSAPDGQTTNPHLGVNYSPGDFAVFNVQTPDSPPRPPVGPVA